MRLDMSTFLLKIAAIDVKSWMSPKTYHTHIISKLL